MNASDFLMLAIALNATLAGVMLWFSWTPYHQTRHQNEVTTLTGSTIINAVIGIMFCMAIDPSLARGWHGHTGTDGGAEIHEHGGRGHNSTYAKAKIEERDRLLDKLKSMNICRGC